MTAGGSDLERTLCAFLPLDIRKIDRRIFALVNFWLWASEYLRPLEMVGELDQRMRRNDLDLGACPGRLGSAGARANQALTAPVRADCSRQHARHRSDRAIQCKFAQHRESTQCVMWNGAYCPHQTERDGKIIVAALLWQISGSEIDGDAARRQCEARRDQCGAAAILCFRQCIVRDYTDM